MITLTYADTPLLLETPEIRKFVRAARPPALRAPRWKAGPHVAWPSPPAARINSLFWPTGARRWATFFGLAETAAALQIIARAGDEEPPRLKLAPGVEPAMRLLPPQPIGCRECECGSPLWLIPLVDERYFWNRRQAGELIVARGDSWSDLFTELATAAGCDLQQDSISAAYLHPDPASMSATYENPAALLDAAAAAVGQCITVSLDGEVRSLASETSQALREANLAEDWPRLSGGEEDFAVPEKATIAFRTLRHFVPSLRNERYLYEQTPPEGMFPAGSLLAGAVERIDSTAYADFTGGDSTPDNDAELTALAALIAADYYARQRYRTDALYAGFIPWRLSGYDDYVAWTFDDQRGPLTSVHSDSREPTLLRQQSDRTIFDTTIKKGVADELLTAGGTGDVSIYENGSATGDTVAARLNWMHGGQSVAADTEVLLQYFHEEQAWVVIGASCE
ncbi:hypothetical protein [Lignipirellula cremea]|uniref:Uncharacterized protein n=1 Tax=Lignipirellula cremea TaxID=2528010 RepID=A0A518E0D8_9BACT|nr:hypothetical protein [Lignipirellula cremea]QDU97543.1 hypothetical protein Pla8534_53910 [Lignipirellula cremea]